MLRISIAMIVAVGMLSCVGCKKDSGDAGQAVAGKTPQNEQQSLAGADDHGPDHDANGGHGAEGEAGHEGHDHDAAGGHGASGAAGHEGHAHDEEVGLGTATIGGLTVTLGQGHGKLEAGKEGHLVVKLPYNDAGATVVRAWIGTEDRTLSMVGKGTYALSHDDYDIHATAPSPLPANVMWWIEIEKPGAAKVVGSGKPIVD